MGGHAALALPQKRRELRLTRQAIVDQDIGPVHLKFKGLESKRVDSQPSVLLRFQLRTSGPNAQTDLDAKRSWPVPRHFRS